MGASQPPKVVCVLVVLLLVGHGRSLLFEPDCAVDTTVCSCAGLTIRCEGRGLTSVPRFVNTGLRYSLLDLSNNNITSLTDSIFANIT
ncbi:hypothetical protein BaRGS_00007064 [Batillaria attramentaria]|uniref:Uncharacterized protein n=1 Tax=Batillaria attramentaria TaxID=370345 RepID=A0ABD0LRG2_9CAEN